MITMILGGLWHGAHFNFIVWGAMHGLALAFDKMRVSLAARFKFNMEKSKLFTVLGVVLTFHFVCFCWIFFKASTFHDAQTILVQIFTNFNATALKPMLSAYGVVFGVMMIGYIIHFVPKSYEIFSVNVLSRISIVGRVAIMLIFIWIIIQVKQSDQVMPIYLQF
jgi:hypothetical protein